MSAADLVKRRSKAGLLVANMRKHGGMPPPFGEYATNGPDSSGRRRRTVDYRPFWPIIETAENAGVRRGGFDAVTGHERIGVRRGGFDTAAGRARNGARRKETIKNNGETE